MKTGKLLDELSGHEGPVHGLMFSPSNVSSLMYHCLSVLKVEIKSRMTMKVFAGIKTNSLKP